MVFLSLLHLAALAALLLLLAAAACLAYRVHRRNRYYRKVQRALDEEEAAFQETLAKNFDNDAHLDDADKAKIQMLEAYMKSATGPDAHIGIAPADEPNLPMRPEDVDKFMSRLAAAATPVNVADRRRSEASQD